MCSRVATKLVGTSMAHRWLVPCVEREQADIRRILCHPAAFTAFGFRCGNL